MGEDSQLDFEEGLDEVRRCLEGTAERMGISPQQLYGELGQFYAVELDETEPIGQVLDELREREGLTHEDVRKGAGFYQGYTYRVRAARDITFRNVSNYLTSVGYRMIAIRIN